METSWLTRTGGVSSKLPLLRSWSQQAAWEHGIWKVFEVFFLTYKSNSVKLIYNSSDGMRVEEHFTRLSQADAMRIATAHPPDKHVLVQIFEK